MAGIDGTIRSNMKSSFWPILNTHVKPNGYATVTLYKDGVKKTHQVHTLILITFVGPCPIGHEARHGTLGKLNNSLENLCWGSKYDNNFTDKHRDGTMLLGENNPTAKLCDFEIPMIRQMYKEGYSQQAIANKFHVHQSVISDVILGIKWKHIV